MGRSRRAWSPCRPGFGTPPPAVQGAAGIRYCQQINITCLNYSYSCPQSLLKLPFQSRKLYPALPAIFTADTIRQLFDAGSGAKIILLQPTQMRNIFNADQDKFLQFVKWLENEITGLLTTCTSTICEPMAYGLFLPSTIIIRMCYTSPQQISSSISSGHMP